MKSKQILFLFVAVVILASSVEMAERSMDDDGVDPYKRNEVIDEGMSERGGIEGLSAKKEERMIPKKKVCGTMLKIGLLHVKM